MNENLPPKVMKQVAKELKHLNETPPEGIKVVVDENDFSTIFADIEGPVGTPYENGIFRMKLLLSNEFPNSPPNGYFLTKIFHPNIGTNGEICVNALKKDWNPTLGLRHVLIVVRCLLIEPFPESALNEHAGKMLLENYEEYARLARLYCSIHAKPKPKQKTAAISESTTALNVDHANVVASTTIQTSVSPTPPKGAESNVSNCQDKNTLHLLKEEPQATTTGAKTGASAIPKKEATYAAAKVQADKKRMDARKKSLKRL